MYNEQLEQLIDAALVDGVLSEKEKQILFKKAQALGVDLDEFEMVLDARLFQLQQSKAGITTTETNNNVSNKGTRSAQELRKLLEKPLSKYANAWKIDYEDDFLEGPVEVLNKLEEAENSVKNTILYFPVPTDKEDMLDFMMFLETQIKQSEFGSTFMVKYNECVEKIKSSFPDEKKFDKYCHGATVQIGAKGKSSYKFNRLLTGLLSLYESDKDLGDIDDSDVKNLILLYPIPSEKEDLVDFMTYLSEQGQESEFANLFKKKYNACARHAETLYPNNKDISNVVRTGLKVPLTVSLKSSVRSFKQGTIKVWFIITRIFKILIIFAVIALIVWVISLISDLF